MIRPGMKVRVRLFGHLAEAAGRGEIAVEISGATAGEVLDRVGRAHPSLKLGGVKLAVNDAYATVKTGVSAGDIVSLLPPVGGG
jgi:molybdopterin converting factor small subunit